MTEIFAVLQDRTKRKELFSHYGFRLPQIYTIILVLVAIAPWLPFAFGLSDLSFIIALNSAFVLTIAIAPGSFFVQFLTLQPGLWKQLAGISIAFVLYTIIGIVVDELQKRGEYRIGAYWFVLLVLFGIVVLVPFLLQVFHFISL